MVTLGTEISQGVLCGVTSGGTMEREINGHVDAAGMQTGLSLKVKACHLLGNLFWGNVRNNETADTSGPNEFLSEGALPELAKWRMTLLSFQPLRPRPGLSSRK